MSQMQNPYKTPSPGAAQIQTGGGQTNALAIVALVFGILSLTIGCCCWTHIPFGLTAVICGFLGMNKAKETGTGNGMALAGVICGGIALVLYTILAIVGLIFNLGVGGAEFMNDLNNI
jgi:hypothetical protein